MGTATPTCEPSTASRYEMSRTKSPGYFIFVAWPEESRTIAGAITPAHIAASASAGAAEGPPVGASEGRAVGGGEIPGEPARAIAASTTKTGTQPVAFRTRA